MMPARFLAKPIARWNIAPQAPGLEAEDMFHPRPLARLLPVRPLLLFRQGWPTHAFSADVGHDPFGRENLLTRGARMGAVRPGGWIAGRGERVEVPAVMGARCRHLGAHDDFAPKSATT